MESLHISFQRVVDAGMFQGIKIGGLVNLSHMFYADDAVFVGEWSESNLYSLVHVLDCFHKVSGLKINMSKSKIMGIEVDSGRVSSAAFKIGCLVLRPYFFILDLTWVEKCIDFNLGMILWIVLGGTLRTLESIRGKFFNGHEISSKKLSWVQWNKVLAPKTRVIKAIHGDDGNIDGIPRNGANSCWVNIINEIKVLAKKGINLMNFMRMKLENGVLTLFWDDGWCEGGRLKDRWTWSLTNSSEYTVASARSLIDSRLLPKGDMKTRWIRYVPIKVNTLAWKVMTNSLPTRFNISRRGIDIDTMSCVKCDLGVETTNHLFFTCDMAKQFSNLIARWWDVPCIDIDSYGN
ncbi:RNA-directed DNA polymerase, eukaryota [Tanacetum coccineum]